MILAQILIIQYEKLVKIQSELFESIELHNIQITDTQKTQINEINDLINKTREKLLGVKLT